MESNNLVGCRVIVELGRNKFYTAIVYKVHSVSPEGYETKPVTAVLDPVPIVNQHQLKLWHWTARYYMCTMGEVFKAALPSGLKLESETKVYLNNDFIADVPITPTEENILHYLSKENSASLSEINRKLGIKNAYPHVKSLLEKGALTTEAEIKKAFKAKTIEMVLLENSLGNDEALNNLLDSLGRARVQQNMVMAYLSRLHSNAIEKEKGIEKALLLDISNGNLQSLKALVEKGVFSLYEKEISRLVSSDDVVAKKQLNSAQEKAFSQIKSFFETKSTVLLHGITSSGKTEVYIHLIEEMLAQGKQVLYLLPEIALTTQIINRLRNVFGSKAGIYHSKFNDNERVEVYNGVNKPIGAEGSIQLVLGVRSSIFLPFNNLGLVIVDEEHENTYKQYDPAPRYHARDTAIYMSTIHGAKVLLGTATPAVETYYNAKMGKFGLVELKERYQNIELPKIIIANTREAYRKKQMKSFFTPQMLSNIEGALAKGEQIILFKNRRGYAPYIECSTCNWIPYCKNCDVTLTYHKHSHDLTCHYCGYSLAIPNTCNVCNQSTLQTKGYGTEKIEDELSIFFPEAKVQRMDLDTTRSKKAYEKIIASFENKEVDILVGTQMISKGLDFDNVSLVGVLNADSMLNFPDFRAHERSFQLMAQVSGRAGRKNKRGVVVIQVSDDQHPIIYDVVHNNYKSLFMRQLEERKLFKYPPFYRLIEIKVKHKDKAVVNKASYYLAQVLFHIFKNRVYGPEFPLVERVQNLFQKNILLKIEAAKAGGKAKDLIAKSIHQMQSINDYKSVRVLVDVDPQ